MWLIHPVLKGRIIAYYLNLLFKGQWFFAVLKGRIIAYYLNEAIAAGTLPVSLRVELLLII